MSHTYDGSGYIEISDEVLARFEEIPPQCITDDDCPGHLTCDRFMWELIYKNNSEERGTYEVGSICQNPDTDCMPDGSGLTLLMENDQTLIWAQIFCQDFTDNDDSRFPDDDDSSPTENDNSSSD